jgi:hypothetical protein
MGLRNCPCDCSATVVATQDSATLVATICPVCDAQGSNVTFTGSGFTFQSTIVKPSSCVTIGGSTSLSVAGEGILTLLSGDEIPAVFTLELIDLTPQVGTDNDVATIRIRSAVGNIQFFIQNDFSPQEAQLTITECPGE